MSEEDRARWNAKHAAAPRHEPEPFVVECLARLRPWPAGVPRTALDVACGAGRHAVLLAREGFDVLAVDASDVAVARTAEAAREAGVVLRAERRDLDEGLPPGTFGLVLCTHFLLRPLWPALRAAVAPGGFLLYETFTCDEAEASGFPRRFCLDEGELQREIAGLDVVAWKRGRESLPGAPGNDSRPLFPRHLESVLARRPADARSGAQTKNR